MWSSLPVPSVQELVKVPLTTVPPLDKPWSEQFTGSESEDRDLGVFKSANGGEEEVLAKSRRYRGIWAGVCCV
ncbi:hypothetical protein Pint_10119 [Pistacia integerrima]|uniref:Uncharacterized protein n=1 Tax=Pistacia integerrima TaxID=434235 RepID=A0ACC0XFS1_9ROSI|nr:hypothetical protein Pint_10119 [Pistacia integerrima]